MDLSLQEQHEATIAELKKIYPKSNFKVRKNQISSFDLHKKITWAETHSLAILCSRILNMSGASVGDINFYKLLSTYILNEEKRAEINAHLEDE